METYIVGAARLLTIQPNQVVHSKGLEEGGGNFSALQAFEGFLLVAFKRISLLLLSMTLMTALAVATAEAQQVPDNSYNPPIENPAYPQGSGPVVAIDEAHYDFHTMQSPPARYGPFATLLQRDGYRVRPFTSQFSAQSLQGVDILVIANARAQSTAAQEPDYRAPVPPAFTDAEVQAVRTWVENGGSLWLMADHFPWPGAAENLASAFGIHMLNGYAMRESSQDPDFYFRRSGSTEVLTNHPITNGRTSTESVNKVVSFTGSAFHIDADRNAQPLLILGPNVVSIQTARAWTWNATTPRIPVEGYYQGAVLRAGAGRVAVFGEAAMFTAQLKDGRPMGMNAPYAEQNYKFVLNVSHWLSGLLNPPPADTTKPTITLTTPAAGATYSLNQVVNANYSCQDEAGGSGLKSCQGTVANGSAIDTASTGTKTFTVTATDNAGNQDSVTRTYSVVDNQPPGDTTPPETTIHSGPSGPTNSRSASFEFSSNEQQGSTFECSLDGAAFSSCTSPRSYTGLTDGSHTFRVRAIDAASNVDASPAERTWKVDTTAPTITLTTPANGATYKLSKRVNANYSCQDEAGGSGLKSCQGTVANGSAIDTASTGTKTFTVTATDNAGNTATITRTYNVTRSGR